MNSLDTYREFLRRGFQFQVMEDRLDVKGTIEPLTPELIDLLKEHKLENLNHLPYMDLENTL